MQKEHSLCTGQAAQPCHERREGANMSAKHAVRFPLMQVTSHGGSVSNMGRSVLGIRHAAYARHKWGKGAHNGHKACQHHRLAAVLPVEVLCLPDEVLRHSMGGSYTFELSGPRLGLAD